MFVYGYLNVTHVLCVHDVCPTLCSKMCSVSDRMLVLSK